MSWAQIASVDRATSLLMAFLNQHHQGVPLDRPVQDFLAGAVADAADDAASQADVLDLAGMVAEMISEYLVPPVKGHLIEGKVAAMIQAVKDSAGIGATHEQMHQQEYIDDAAHRIEGLSLRPAAQEFVPRAAAAPFVPPGSSSGGAAATTVEEAAGAEAEEWEEGQEYCVYYSNEHGYAEDEEDHGVPCISSEEAVELLVMQFPHYSTDYLEQLLACNGGDVVLSMEVLSQYEAGFPPSAQGESREEEEAVETEAPPPVIDDESSFPTLGGAGSGTVLATGWGRTDGFADALRKRPKAPPPPRYQPPGVSTVGSQQQQAGSRSARSGWQGAASSGSAPVQWVETGVAVERMYTDARAEARDQARIRNAYFEQATQAYLSGNRALAKELGAKGRAAGEEMKAAHAAASKQIYSSRNSGQEGVVDLHGLHTSEAISILGQEMRRLKEQGHRQAHVLVGTGHHTKTRHSTLPVAVEGYLKERAIPFRVAQAGLLEVKLS